MILGISIFFDCRFSVFAGRGAELISEVSGKIKLIAKAEAVTDFTDTAVCVYQLIFRFRHQEVVNVFCNRLPQFFFEKHDKLALRTKSRFRNLAYGELGVQMGTDISDRFFYARRMIFAFLHIDLLRLNEGTERLVDRALEQNVIQRIGTQIKLP